MKRLMAVCLALLLGAAVSAQAQVDKGTFYEALSSGEEDSIDQMLSKLEGEKSTSKMNAYKGALTMKKAGFVKGVGGKVKTFKRGAHLLEDEIKSNPGNTEFRFLRLTIQEHAPGILKYNKEIDADKQAVVSGYARLDADLKNVIAGYAKDSKVLKESDLK
ncbi:hypothetical protein [Dyadobacter fermentans]|uniref:Uncharacterized protein n=1 Tax=Dyadobacter fermentans (strain ATCC 700827 / DSM 18053 / CIP 107007 / KCTC 52180 / NS114) TaxID=471854 RepID=C6VY82_DYAFD|nr:hypothetical protein [Dyadobacter fermentans]ACT96983.1 conserved hypothetical protein [Dyadobacter fermentans DSM 18053]